jgi:flagellar basal body-associated protein FliL
MLVIRNTELLDDVKSHLLSIRSGVLMVTSMTSASDLLSPIGKGRYASEILNEANSPFGWTKGHATAGSDDPIKAVAEILFSTLLSSSKTASMSIEVMIQLF